MSDQVESDQSEPRKAGCLWCRTPTDDPMRICSECREQGYVNAEEMIGVVRVTAFAESAPRVSAAPIPQHRILRVLEYVGTPDFIRDAVDRRTVKGRHEIRGNPRDGRSNVHGYIQEAILGETAEVVLGSRAASAGDLKAMDVIQRAAAKLEGEEFHTTGWRGFDGTHGMAAGSADDVDDVGNAEIYRWIDASELQEFRLTSRGIEQRDTAYAPAGQIPEPDEAQPWSLLTFYGKPAPPLFIQAIRALVGHCTAVGEADNFVATDLGERVRVAIEVDGPISQETAEVSGKLAEHLRKAVVRRLSREERA